MNVVGRVGSLISQGVYSVATPFHPFGGAVDIIVVEQEDGTYRSTPWYVCFGKFQGVLQGAEKMVTISVNGIDADFHMYLDNSGKAYFMREVMSGGEEMESNNPSNVYSENKEETENDDQSYRHQDEQSSPQSSSGYGAYHYGSVNEVEDLVKSSEESNSEMVLVSVDGHVLTVPISSNEDNMDNVQLSTPQFHLGPGEGSGEEFGASGDVWEVGLFGELDESMPKNMDALGNQSEVLKDGGEATRHADEVHITVNTDMPNCTENTSAHLNKDEMFKSCLDFTIHAEDSDLHDANFLSVELGRKDDSRCSPGNSTFCKVPVEEQVVARDDSDLRNDSLEPVSIGIKDVEINEVDSKCENDQSAGNCDQPCCNSPLSKNIMIEATEDKTLNTENTLNSPSHDRSTRSVTNDLEDVGSVPGRLLTGEDCRHTETSRLQESICGFGFEISLCGNLIRPGMGRCSAEEAFDAHRISQEEFKESGPSIIKNGNLIVRFEERYFTWDKAAHILIGKAVFGSQFSVEPNDPIPVEHDETPKAGEDPNSISQSYSRRWRLWSIPFRRGKSLHHSDGNSSNEELFLNSESVLQNPNAEQTSNSNNSHSPRKQYSRTNIPTTEQIATLNLKEGQNKIAFSFSTRVLGKQEVDAHIYLWKWNARIVISDVDGTITKSDVLGQFMPLVGRDWTQSGVARLFSAIKENGYQLLFLSARAIVQAYLTRSFLLNLKQDGKALPSGPVVISPDGLFPSLYREVIRRAPHEFKIACLEDIRALFPSDYNPFYAGFGNRDTDELSYRKIGIPKGKIFIINPKGEVAINNCTEVKSYSSLHTLVNDMFPSTSLVEPEDFNSWNYWKTPLAGGF